MLLRNKICIDFIGTDINNTKNRTSVQESDNIRETAAPFTDWD